MATVTVTGISSNTTFTASYSNVSDTCTVTVPAPAYSLQFSQDTYISLLFDDVTVSCTLKEGNTPMSGETITFSYESMLGPESVTATTNSSGVANYTFSSFDFSSLPATLTAEYQGVSTTCTIVGG